MAKKKKEEPQYLGVDEFASKVGYSPRHIRRLIQAGEVKASRAPERRKWQIHHSEVGRFRGKPQLVDERSAVSEREGLPTEQPGQANIDPVTMKRKGAHFADLASVASSLLAHDLDRVLHPCAPISFEGEEPFQPEYLWVKGSRIDDYYLPTKEQLSSILEHNIKSTANEYKEWFFHRCFLPHLFSELQDEVKTRDIMDIAREQPYQLIGTLRLLAERKTFKGTCPVCKDWQ